MSVATKTAAEKKPAAKKPVSSTSALASKAMLVKITIHSSGLGMVTDEDVTTKVASDAGADRDTGRYGKKRFDYKVLGDITTAVNSLRNRRDRLTLPWENDGWRVVSAATYFKLIEEVNAGRDMLTAAVEAFIANMDEHLANEKKRQGKLFDPSIYLTPEQIRLRYGVSVAYKGISDGSDIRLSIGNEELAKVKASAKAEAEATLKSAVQDIWHRFADVVEKMVKRLNAYQPATESERAKGTFHDSLVENIKDVLEVAPLLNITNDPSIAAFADRIGKELTANSAEVLRDDDKVRKTVAQQAEDILAGMQAYLQ